MKKKIVFMFASLILLCFVFIAPLQAQNGTLNGLNETAQQIDAFSGQTGDNYQSFIQNKTGQIIGAVLSFIGVLFFILMIYAGITWMTAAGNDQQVTKAKNLMINAVVGILVVFAAYALTMFIGNEFIN